MRSRSRVSMHEETKGCPHWPQTARIARGSRRRTGAFPTNARLLRRPASPPPLRCILGILAPCRTVDVVPVVWAFVSKARHNQVCRASHSPAPADCPELDALLPCQQELDAASPAVRALRRVIRFEPCHGVTVAFELGDLCFECVLTRGAPRPVPDFKAHAAALRRTTSWTSTPMLSINACALLSTLIITPTLMAEMREWLKCEPRSE